MKIFRLFPIIMAIGKLYVSIKWLDVEPAELYLNSVSCHNLFVVPPIHYKLANFSRML